jgi:hypothetical protein
VLKINEGGESALWSERFDTSHRGIHYKCSFQD